MVGDEAVLAETLSAGASRLKWKLVHFSPVVQPCGLVGQNRATAANDVFSHGGKRTSLQLFKGGTPQSMCTVGLVSNGHDDGMKYLGPFQQNVACGSITTWQSLTDTCLLIAAFARKHITTRMAKWCDRATRKVLRAQRSRGTIIKGTPGQTLEGRFSGPCQNTRPHCDLHSSLLPCTCSIYAAGGIRCGHQSVAAAFLGVLASGTGPLTLLMLSTSAADLLHNTDSTA